MKRPVDVLDIRNALLQLVADADDGVLSDAVAQPSMRNSFCVRLQENGPIYTVGIQVGGALSHTKGSRHGS